MARRSLVCRDSERSRHHNVPKFHLGGPFKRIPQLGNILPNDRRRIYTHDSDFSMDSEPF
jgi:hypothetical protein